jgi:hypothetical protein
MNKVIIALVAGLMFNAPATAVVEDYEALENVSKAAECFNNNKLDMDVRWASGRRYNAWTKLRDVRRISPTEFEFLVPTSSDNGFRWVDARFFSELRCKEVK